MPESKKIEKKKFEWTKQKKIAATVIGVAFASAIVFGILVVAMRLGGVRPIRRTEQEAVVVGECAGYEVRYDELRFITITCRSPLEAKYGKYDTLGEAEKSAFEAELEAKVLDTIENNYAVFALANEYEINTNSHDIEKKVQEKIELFVEQNYEGDFDLYKNALSEMGLSDAFFRLVQKVDCIEELLLEKLESEKIGVEYGVENITEFTDYVMTSGDYVRTIHVFYPKALQHIDTSDSKQRAEDAAEMLKAIVGGEARYSAMRSAIGEAPFVPGISMTSDGIYFTYGQMGDAYESAAFALDIYGVSDVVETADGYYVIMRLEPELETVRRKAGELLSQYQYAVIKKAIDGQKQKIEFAPNEAFDALSLVEIK